MSEPTSPAQGSPLERMARPLRETVKRMDCPSVMREHLWSIEREGMIECLWCFERRRSEDRERPNDPKLSDCGGESASRSSSLERMVGRRWIAARIRHL